MRGVYMTGYGSPADVVRVGELPQPACGEEQVLIEVRAAGVNPVDWKLVEGRMRSTRPVEFPAQIGYDAAGVVREVGAAVTSFRPGDEVFTRVDARHPGTFAEWVAVDAELVALKPANLGFVEAAAVPLAALTAWQGLFEQVKLQRGEKILIQGGAGGVGSFAVQFARHVGAHVATTVGPDHVALARRLGAEVVIDHTSQRFEERVREYDAVFDTVGGETGKRSLAILRHGGVLVSTVGAPESDDPGKRVISFYARPDGAQLTEMARLIEGGAILPVIDHVYPLDEAPRALLQSRDGHAGGKIVIRVH